MPLVETLVRMACLPQPRRIVSDSEQFPRRVAAPVASIQVVDKVHLLADELHILDVKSNYIGTDHYFNVNDVPSHEETVEKINKIVLNWR